MIVSRTNSYLPVPAAVGEAVRWVLSRASSEMQKPLLLGREGAT